MLELQPNAVNDVLPGLPLVEPRTRYAYGTLVWMISLIFVLFQFFLQLSSAEIVEGLMQSFYISAFGAGVLASIYYYIYVVLQTPVGILLDRYGPRRLLSMGAIGVSIGCLLFAGSQNLVIAALGRLIMGAGAAFAFVGSMNLAGRWFPPKHFSLIAAIAETVGMLGSIIGGLFLAHSMRTYGWRHCMLIASVTAVVIGIALWVIVRDTPDGQPIVRRRSSMSELWQDLKLLIHNKAAWINGIYSGFSFSIISVFVALWGIPYFQMAHHISLLMATLLGDLVFIGVALGGPILGWIDARTHFRRVTMASLAIFATILLLIIILCPDLSLMLSAILMTLLGVCASGYVLTFIIANEIVPRSLRSTAIGFTNTMSVGVAPIFQPLVGLVLTKVALSHHAVNHLQYVTTDYQWALLIVPGLTAVAAFLAFYLPERRP